MKPEDRIWQLLSKKESGDITAEELSELKLLLRNNESIAAANGILEEIMNNKITIVEQPLNTGASWNAIKDRMAQYGLDRKKKINMVFGRIAVAASVLLIAGVAWLYLYHHNTEEKASVAKASPNQVSTSLGSKSKIILPDGTKVWLNAGSRIVYNNFGNGPVREVSLWGEAFFDVVHNDLQPFVVHTAIADIRDLGTTFAVKVYPDDKNFETTLIEGSVEVIDHQDSERKILLKPKEKLTISFADSVKTKQKANPQATGLTMLYKIDKVEKDAHGLLPETAWTQNKLVFNNEPFAQLAERMERWYNVSFHFEDTLIEQTPFSGIIETETLEQALQAMQFSRGFRYRLQGANVWISK